MCHDFGLTSLQIFMKFGMNVLGTKVGRRMCKGFLFPPLFKMAADFLVFFAVTGTETGRSTVHITTSSAISTLFILAELLKEGLCSR